MCILHFFLRILPLLQKVKGIREWISLTILIVLTLSQILITSRSWSGNKAAVVPA